ncbi:hypothetical protein LGQ02_03230 [Bacillus shivajii]|uniref:hypothetical protein n=1 Tax=Bacillus shivajii TaxID=1983719 RepID=UPI001CFBC6B2|nr:hypothetical protein [Bacillus shivajii]UCZ53813.1 hypothetical protein LGQ02_03230 [Bacillus shivajii]
MSDFVKCIFFILSIVSFFIGTIAGIITSISLFTGTEVLIHSWTAVVLFAAGTFFWIIPLQVIDWLHFIPVQRRIKRIIYPYVVTFLQVGLFVFYIIGLNSRVTDLVFTNMGLIIYSVVIVLLTKVLLTWLASYARKVQKERWQLTVHKQ